MAKKKATMTLKDFHGGSIPSDLPLPSAPGAIVKPSDRVGFDRPNAWGRNDHRLRPGSAGSVRAFDDKTPFSGHVMHIGRNFDEDERTPLDGVSRRVDREESVGVEIGGSERVGFSPSSGSYVARFAEGVGTESGSRVGGYRNVGGNPWGLRKDEVVRDQVPVLWSAPDAATKLAHASALEKVSSGRWRSNQVNGNRVDVEVITHPEPQVGSGFMGYGVQEMKKSQEAIMVRHVEQSLIVDDGVHASGKVLPVHEKVVPPISSGVKERNHQILDDGYHASRDVGKFVRSEPLEPSSERPKLNLLPRSRPIDNVEPTPADYKQAYQIPRDPHDPHADETHKAINTLKVNSESGDRVQDRPKLNLKPRLQPLDQLEVSIEEKRNTLFGDARPRELVLKERGVDSVAVDQVHLSHRIEQDVPKGEISPLRYNGKAGNVPLDHRIVKNIDRDYHRDAEKSDFQRKNWRSENRRSSRDLEKQQPDRPLSPETWRKPVEQPTSPTGLRYGKAASAVELAQAFSKSVSDPKTADRVVRGQIPFSRLTGPQSKQSRPHSNGY
ncbi:Eukaryotic translation initiation factor-related protein [Heracleum sosnowskyi]|uniref:Eukaryotic translation initiation factor-related protein n=1 Tax=Heracleum sosnowskyi TaxID=360622 RepID=A0AAD8HJP8_9APIA|nr:Eukaryotic translation initiation factor-related protein [Heracleum sosnowskyi]